MTKTYKKIILLQLLMHTVMGFLPPSSTQVLPMSSNSKHRSKKNMVTLQRNSNEDINTATSVDKSLYSILLGLSVASTKSFPANAQDTITSLPSTMVTSIDKIQPTQLSFISQTTQLSSSIQTNIVKSSHLLAANTPMGDLPENSSINPTLSTFGQYFFLLYVVVSLLAGGKEVLGRIGTWLKKKDD